jgi:transposase-like protein
MVAFREVILNHLRKKQQRRCALCGQTIQQHYQERVVYIEEPDDGEGDYLANLQMIHSDCTHATKIVDDRSRQANELLDRGMSTHQVSIILKVSERTVQRYAKRRKKKTSR